MANRSTLRKIKNGVALQSVTAESELEGIPVAVTLADMNTLKVATPALNAGKCRVAVTNPDGETASVDASFTAN